MNSNTEIDELSLDKYFQQNISQIDEKSVKTSDPKSEIETPPVCTLFSDPSPQSKDPTASFFDLLGNTYGGNTNLSSGTLASDEYGSHVLSCTEVERRRGAWIATDKTRQCLITISTSAPGSYFPERELLTMPGVLLNEELGDVIGDAVSICFGDTVKRRSYTSSEVTQDERGLRELIQAGAYSAAINLTTNLLSIYGQGKGRANHPSKHSPHSLQLWFTRIALLIKLKLYTIAHNEAEQFGQLEKPDLFYQFYPDMYKGRPGSMAPFSFRLLLAELPMHCSKPKEALTKLFNLLAVIRQILSNLERDLCEDGNPAELRPADRSDSRNLWRGRETRTLHSIVNCALALRDFALAIELLDQLVLNAQHTGLGDTSVRQAALLSAVGRLRLQLGDVAGAEVSFKQCKELCQPAEGNATEIIRDIVDRGLLAVAQNAFGDAYVCFQQAHALDSNNVMVINNMGVCLLYGGKLKEAIALFESAIFNNPSEGLHESLLLNLSTLYDMESANSKTKKLALLKQIAQCWADAPAGVLERFYN